MGGSPNPAGNPEGWPAVDHPCPLTVSTTPNVRHGLFPAQASYAAIPTYASDTYSMEAIREEGMMMVVSNKVVTVTNPWAGVS